MAKSVPAVRRAFDILELFLERPRLSNSEIRESLGLPRTTTHELVATLVERSYLAPVPGQRHRYQLGVAAIHLGSAYSESTDLARVGRAVATHVNAACDETVHVAVLDGSDVVYVAKVDSTHPVRMVSAVGRRLPAHCTAVGKLLLAQLGPDELERRLPPDRELVSLTANSITDPSRLADELDEIRRTGLAFDVCESNDAVCCVAAAVLDHTGAATAGISISVPILRWNEARRQELADLAQEGAQMLSEKLGYRP